MTSDWKGEEHGQYLLIFPFELWKCKFFCYEINGINSCDSFCAVQPDESICGTILGLQCQNGAECVDLPGDECNSLCGGSDCADVCITTEDACDLPPAQVGECDGICERYENFFFFVHSTHIFPLIFAK